MAAPALPPLHASGDPSPFNGVVNIGKQPLPTGFQMLGEKYGIVTVALNPGMEFHSEPGAMMFMSDDVKMQVGMMNRGLMGAISGGISGESLVKTKYTNGGSTVGYVGITSNTPFCTPVPLAIASLPGHVINVKRGAWMGGTPDVTASVKVLPSRSCMACCCGGMPPLIQEVSGQPGGMAFLSSSGTIITKELAAGETFVCDTNSIVGFGKDVQYDVKQVGSCVTMCCGGEGCFNTTLTGPGPVYLQSITIDNLMPQLVTVQKDAKKGDGGGGAPAAPDAMERQQ